MPAEKYVTEFVKEAGFTPIPDRAIIVTYAPANMSERIAKFFSNEFFALQMCQDSLVFHSYFWLEGCIGYSCLTGRFCRITPA